MRGSKDGYDSFEEFEREELHAHRNGAWSIDDLVDDFVIGDEELDLELLESEREEESSDEEDDG